MAYDPRKRIKHSKVFDLMHCSGINPATFIEHLQKMIAEGEIPADAEFEPHSTGGLDGSPAFEWFELETDEQYASRMEHLDKREAFEKDKERQEYERLKAKFEG